MEEERERGSSALRETGQIQCCTGPPVSSPRRRLTTGARIHCACDSLKCTPRASPDVTFKESCEIYFCRLKLAEALLLKTTNAPPRTRTRMHKVKLQPSLQKKPKCHCAPSAQRRRQQLLHLSNKPERMSECFIFRAVTPCKL